MIRRLESPTGRRFHLEGAKKEDEPVHTISVDRADYKGARGVVEFLTEGDAAMVATLLVDLGAYSSVEVLESHGIFVRSQR